MTGEMANRFNYIAIEGVIGAGKTALAERLAERHNARLILEEFEENPFLPKFYEDHNRFAFQTQLAFLASRFKQQKHLNSGDLFHDFIISDYIFEKDRIFASLNLDEDELSLYNSIYQVMAGIAAKPDLVIYLQSSAEKLIEQIRNRGRQYEKSITESYLRELSESYNHFFYHYDRAPLLVINTRDTDFIQNPDHLSYIEEQVFERPIRSKTHIHILPE
ncbi:MAG: deoxynucleoside kinase [Balneolaceae bacterium]